MRGMRCKKRMESNRLPGKHEVLSSSPSTTKKKKKKRIVSKYIDKYVSITKQSLKDQRLGAGLK
jgi:hypothetical protein